MMSANQKKVGQTVVGSAAAVAAAAGGAAGAHAQGAVANWQGPYIGAQGGLTWLHSNHGGSTDGISTTNAGAGYGAVANGESISNASDAGAQLGFLAGWNFQNQHLVYGPELGFTWMGAKANANGGLTQAYTFGATTYSYAGSVARSSRVRGVIDLAGRVGWDMNGALPYVKAGFALGQIHSSWSFTGFSGYAATNNRFSTSKTSLEPGFVFGVGLEEQIGPGWSVRGELSWMYFADQTLSNPAAIHVNGYSGTGTSVGPTGKINFQDSVLNATLGINYRF